MSKPRRPRYQRQHPTPALAPAAAAAPAVVQDAGFQEPASEPAPLDPPAEILPAPVVEAAAVPAAALAATSPRLLNAETFGTTVMNYVIGEGEAFAAHLRALAGARSMADFVRLQIGEFQRAADSTLTCWGMLTVSASRSFTAR